MSVKQAEKTAEIFNRHREGMAICVFGHTPKDDRRSTLQQYAAGEIQVLVNVGVATEGFDDPSIAVVAVGRPTKSRSLYAQMVGRGTRTLTGLVDGMNLATDRRKAIAESGKSCLLVLDFSGNSGKHKLVSAADVLGGRFADEDVQAAKVAIERAGSSADISEEIEKAKSARLLRTVIEADRLAQIRAKAEFTYREIDPFHSRDYVPQAKTFPKHWYWTLATEKQRNILAKRGLYLDGMTIAQASNAIDGVAKKEGWRKTG